MGIYYLSDENGLLSLKEDKIMPFTIEEFEILLKHGVIAESTLFSNNFNYVCLNKHLPGFYRTVQHRMDLVESPPKIYTFYVLRIHFKPNSLYDVKIPFDELLNIPTFRSYVNSITRGINLDKIYPECNIPIHVEHWFDYMFNNYTQQTKCLLEERFHIGVVEQIDYIELLEYATADVFPKERSVSVLRKHYLEDATFIQMEKLKHEYIYWHELNTPDIISATPWV